MTDKKIIHSLIEQELKEANDKFPQFASDHEAFAVVFEEFQETEDELKSCGEGLLHIWEQVKRNYNTHRNYEMVENNAVQLI